MVLPAIAISQKHSSSWNERCAGAHLPSEAGIRETTEDGLKKKEPLVF